MLRNYVKVAWRHLRGNRVFSSINILGLCVGLCVCTLLSLYIWQECSYDRYHPNVDRLYQVGTLEIVKSRQIRFQGCPNTLAGQFKSVFPQVEATARICRLLAEEKTLLTYYPGSGNENARSFYEEDGFLADSGFFRLFKYDFVEGNPATAIDGPYSMVISTEIATRLFGGSPALHKVIHVSSAFNGDHDYLITGVFRPINAPSHINGRFFLSMYGGHTGELLRTWTNTTSNYFFNTYVRLKPGADPAQIERQLPAFVDTYEGKDLRAAGYARKHFLLPVKDIHLYANMETGDVTPGGSVTYLYILGSIAFFTLLIACFNFMNLSTARSMKRSAEVGVRKTLGAPRSDLVRQFLGESVLMALLAYAGSLCLTFLLLPEFNKLAGKNIELTPAQTGVVALAGLGLSLLTGLAAGCYPALYLSSFKPVRVLKGKIANSLAVSTVRKGLVVLQFCISIVLIVAAMIIARQMQYLRSSDLGFTKDHQLILPLRSENARKLFVSLKTELQKNPHVLSAAGSFLYPGHMGWSGSYYADGHPSTDNYMFLTNGVDFDYMKTLNLQAVSGHIFSSEYPSDSVNGIIINETGARALGYTPENAVGKGFHNSYAPQDPPLKIVGVIRDFHSEDLHIPIGNVAFWVNSSPTYYYITAHVQAADLQGTIASISKTWHDINPNEPFEYTFLDENFMQHYQADIRVATLVDYSTVIAIFISCLGLFGLAAFSAEQRTKEIGIRKVLGAGSIQIVALLSVDFLRLVLLGVLLGSPLGWYFTHRWLQDFAYRTSVPWTLFFVTTGTALLIAMATISMQALKAALAKPVKSLRNE